MPDEPWPPLFTLDQERILNLLTGDRFYSNPSAALREAVLNAVDAVQRRRTNAFEPDITVTFNIDDLTIAVADNGIGMNRADVNSLFTKVGASAATAEAKKKSVGEFGIGVISYFMAGDAFDLQGGGTTTWANNPRLWDWRTREAKAQATKPSLWYGLSARAERKQRSTPPAQPR